MADDSLFSSGVRNFINGATVAESIGKVADKIGNLNNITKKMSEKQGGGKGTEFKNGSDKLDDMLTEIRAATEKPALNKGFRN